MTTSLSNNLRSEYLKSISPNISMQDYIAKSTYLDVENYIKWLENEIKIARANSKSNNLKRTK